MSDDGDAGYCQPCGECRDCKKAGAEFHELRKLRRWRRRVLKLFAVVHRTIEIGDPENEQPILRTVRRRMNALEKSSGV